MSEREKRLSEFIESEGRSKDIKVWTVVAFLSGVCCCIGNKL